MQYYFVFVIDILYQPEKIIFLTIFYQFSVCFFGRGQPSKIVTALCAVRCPVFFQ